MNGDDYLKFKNLRDKYDDQIGNKLQSEVLMDKQDCLDLFGSVLGRSRAEVKLLAKVTAVTPKQKTAGNQLETKLLSQFFASDQARLGELFDEWVMVRLEPAPLSMVDGVQGIKHESHNLNREEPTQSKLPFEGEGSADSTPATEGGAAEQPPTRTSSVCPSCGGKCYRGEGSEEPCEDCGATGVIWSMPEEAVPRETCKTCEGTCNVADGEGFLSQCPDCHGIGTVPVPPEQGAAEDHESDSDDSPQLITCPECNGTRVGPGGTEDEPLPCEYCEGTGQVEVQGETPPAEEEPVSEEEPAGAPEPEPVF